MGFSFIPTVNECCIWVENLKKASYAVGVFCFFKNIIYYAVTLTSSCLVGEKMPELKCIATFATFLLIVASVALLLGLCYNNERFLRFFIIVGMVVVFLEAVGGYLFLNLVIVNLSRCYGMAYLYACFGLIWPLVLFYCIIIVHSWREEFKLIPKWTKNENVKCVCAPKKLFSF